VRREEGTGVGREGGGGGGDAGNTGDGEGKRELGVRIEGLCARKGWGGMAKGGGRLGKGSRGKLGDGRLRGDRCGVEVVWMKQSKTA